MAKIKKIISYEMYHERVYDIAYESGRVATHFKEDLPKTAQKFIEECGEPTEHYSKVFNRKEFVYEKEHTFRTYIPTQSIGRREEKRHD